MLPVDDRQLDIEPVMRDEVLYASADPGRATDPVTLEAIAEAPLALYDANYGDADPTRPGGRRHDRRAGGGRRRAAAAGVHTAPFAEPLYDTPAIAKQRGLPLSPATRELVSIAVDRIRAFERRRARGEILRP